MNTPGEEKTESRGTVLLRLAPMFQDFCRLFHGSAPRERYVPKGLLAKCSPKKMPKLCAECRHHLTLAATKKMVCRKPPELACSRCPEVCTTEEHRIFVRNIMLFRVFLRFIRLEWGPLWRHFFPAGRETGQSG